MKHTLKQVFSSTRFVIGFAIFMFILLTVIIYPLFVTTDPLGIIGEGTFFPPGIYVSVYDSMDSTQYTLHLQEAAARRVASKMGDEERLDIKEWLIAYGISEDEIDMVDTEKLLGQWVSNYDPTEKNRAVVHLYRFFLL